MTDVWADGRVRLGVGWALVAVALLMQAALFPRQSLWADEIFSLAMATGHSLEQPADRADPAQGDFVQGDTARTAADWRRYIQHETPAAGPGRVVRAVFLSDTNPPGYYLLLSGWTRLLGASDWTLRIFSVVWSVACIPLIMRIAARVGPPSLGLMAAALFVFCPPACYYFAEGRMYSLLWFCTVAAIYFTIRLGESPVRLWPSVMWVLVSAAGLLVHYFFVFPWAAMVGFLMVKPGSDRRWWLVLRCVLVGALILPWYLRLPESLQAWRVTMDWLNLRPSGFGRFSAARDLLLQFLSGRTLSLWHTPHAIEFLALGAIAIAAGVTTWRLRARVFAGPRLLIWLWLVAAWSGPLAVDAWRGTYTAGIPRYAIAGLPAACLLIAGGLAGVGARWRMVLLATILGAWSVSLVSIYRWRWRSGSPTREVAMAVAAKGDPAELILVHSIPSGVLGLANYAAPTAEIASWVGQLGTRRVPDSLRSLLAGRALVRFVRIHDVGEPAPEETWLRENAVVVNESRIGPALVLVCRPRGAATF